MAEATNKELIVIWSGALLICAAMYFYIPLYQMYPLVYIAVLYCWALWKESQDTKTYA